MVTPLVARDVHESWGDPLGSPLIETTVEKDVSFHSNLPRLLINTSIVCLFTAGLGGVRIIQAYIGRGWYESRIKFNQDRHISAKEEKVKEKKSLHFQWTSTSWSFVGKQYKYITYRINRKWGSKNKKRTLDPHFLALTAGAGWGPCKMTIGATNTKTR